MFTKRNLLILLSALLLVLLVLCLRQLSLGIRSGLWAKAAVGSSVILISAGFFVIPHGWIRATRTAEKMLVERMQFVTENLKYAR